MDKGEIKITLTGRVPSKKNSRQAIYVRGRTIMIPSKEYKAWHEVAEWELRQQIRGQPKLPEAEIEITFHPPDRIKGDLTNKAESVMDLLVDAGILEDDNWTVVKKITLKIGEVDKSKPRAEVTIKELK